MKYPLHRRPKPRHRQFRMKKMRGWRAKARAANIPITGSMLVAWGFSFHESGSVT